MAEIKCPMCSKLNPEELEVCQFCEARLKPLTDELSRAQPPIQPGDDPTPMDTGELEPVLPRWLREVRQKARDSVDDEPEQPQEDKDAAEPEGSPDLLAGLQSQGEDDEEIPDWLTGLRGEGGQAATEGTSEDDDQSALKSMFGDETPVSQEGEESSLPGWVSDLGESEAEKKANEDEPAEFLTEESTEPAEKESEASDSDLEWAADFRTESLPPIDSADESLPDWLQAADEETTSEDKAAEADSALEGEKTVQPTADESDTPDWLSSLGEERAGEIPQQEPVPSSAESEIPDWLSSVGEESIESPPHQEAEKHATEGELPDQLASLEDDLTAPSDESLQMPAFVEEVAQSTHEDETPDWLSSLEEGATTTDKPDDQAGSEILATEDLAEETGTSPAFVDDEGDPLSTDDLDTLLSMDIPEWLSDMDVQEGDSSATPTDAQEDNLRPADLPNWVQAMRPVESVITETSGEGSEKQPMEDKGPLAGLRGVLPAVPGVGPSSVPKAYSIKLQASEDEQSNAVMLEQMLEEEINPKPIVTQKVVISQRILRWVIAFLLLLVVGGPIFAGTQINPMPTGAPLETSMALRYIQEALPADAPVLMIFDYEAALVGELEAAAIPLIDHMLLLKHPRLGLVASTPTGTGLAEQFMTSTQVNHNYQRGQQFTNLGYIPGEAAGVLAFAENPVAVKPLTINGASAWNSPALQDVGRLSDFAAIILLTSDAESARIWIEQTENSRGEARFLVVSSAQSGPMILPYVQSGQVDGMVTGLDGSAPIEQANSGRPGIVRRYWDAYGFGLLTAVGIISLGSLWSLGASWLARRKEQGQG